MDPEDLRSVLRSTGADLWALIDAAISVAAAEHRGELRARRDGIVERLYSAAPAPAPAPIERSRAKEEAKGSSSPVGGGGAGASASPPTPQSMQRDEEVEAEEPAAEAEEEEEEDDRRDYGRPIDAEQKKILAIKDFLEDPDQSDDSLVSLLQNLADMDITFKALKETDIGRHVNGLRKHPSSEVRRLVKQLVRRWKDIVDEWVKASTPLETASPAIITEGDSPQLINGKSSGHQVPDFACSPIPHNGHLSSERNSSEPVEQRAKATVRRDAPPRPGQSSHSTPQSAPPRAREPQKESLLDPERLASARKRLHDNYQEAQNAKKQRTIQVMDIHEIPKPKNSFMARGKGGFQAKHW